MGVSVSKSRLVNVIVVLRLLIKSIIVKKETKVLFGVVVMMILPSFWGDFSLFPKSFSQWRNNKW